MHYGQLRLGLAEPCGFRCVTIRPRRQSSLVTSATLSFESAAGYGIPIESALK